MDLVELSHEPLSIEQIYESVLSSSCGAVSIFSGTTRDSFECKTVIQLEYEAYESMAKLEMQNICQEIRNAWLSIENIRIVHRLGIVPIKEASIVIAISSPHRKDSLHAVEFAIDAIKARVPIWKKEVYSDGKKLWKENSECFWSNVVK